MAQVVRIKLPASFSADSRVDRLRVYKIKPTSQKSELLSEVPLGTLEVLDSDAVQGTTYYYTAKNNASGLESPASPVARVFRHRDTLPFTI